MDNSYKVQFFSKDGQLLLNCETCADNAWDALHNAHQEYEDHNGDLVAINQITIEIK